jgi:hypothetical protein
VADGHKALTLLAAWWRARSADDKDLGVEKLVADAADVSPVIDYRKNTDAVFGAECNNFHRIVVLWRRVSLKGQVWMGV